MTQERQAPIEVMIAGLGGYGVLLMGRLLAEAGMLNYKHVLFFPNYGPRMRWGDCECTVVLSNEDISSPVALTPNFAMAMSLPTFKELGKRLRQGGTMVVNSSVVKEKTARDDIKVWNIPAAEVAIELGSPRVFNMVLLGAFVEAIEEVSLEDINIALDKRLSGAISEALLTLNKKALREGARLVAHSEILG